MKRSREGAMKRLNSAAVILFMLIACQAPVKKESSPFSWQHLSSKNGDIAVPNPGNQQTASAVFDVDLDGYNDFIITERTAAPSVVWYQYNAKGWQRFII